MKRVAVIGCSHSSFNQYADTDSVEWPRQLANRSDEWEIHNFSTRGHGIVWFEYILRKIIVDFPEDYFDTVIIQFTTSSRWILPYKIEGINPEAKFIKTQITHNYFSYEIDCPRLTVMSPMVVPWYVPNEKVYKTAVKQSKVVHGAYEPNGIITNYEELFLRTFDRQYSPFFKKLLYFDFGQEICWDIISPVQHHRCNMDLELPFMVYLLRTYGDKYIVEYLVDDSFHCTKAGNDILFNDYLIPSKFGTHFNLKNNT